MRNASKDDLIRNLLPPERFEQEKNVNQPLLMVEKAFDTGCASLFSKEKVMIRDKK